MSDKSMVSLTPDIAEAPVQVATEDEIRTSPYELMIDTGRVVGEIKDRDFIAVSLISGRVGISILPVLSPLTNANVGTDIQDKDGNAGTLLGTYVVCGVDGRLAFLRLMSNRPCSEYDWCLGHEDHSGDILRHSAKPETVFTFDSDNKAGGRFPGVEVSRFIENDIERFGVTIDYDLELTHADMLKLADELEAASKKVRALA